MDEMLLVFLLIFGMVMMGAVGLIIHEYVESNYDKCLDACVGLEEVSEPDCISKCNDVFSDINCIKDEVKV